MKDGINSHNTILILNGYKFCHYSPLNKILELEVLVKK